MSPFAVSDRIALPRVFRAIVLGLVLLTVSSANGLAAADDGVFRPLRLDVEAAVTTVGVLELGAVALSGLASASPEVAGALLVSTGAGAVFLGALIGDDGEALAYAMPLAIGLYNLIELRKDEYSDDEVFGRNLIAWNALAVVAAVTATVSDTSRLPLRSRYALTVDDGYVGLRYAVDF